MRVVNLSVIRFYYYVTEITYFNNSYFVRCIYCYSSFILNNIYTNKCLDIVLLNIKSKIFMCAKRRKISLVIPDYPFIAALYRRQVIASLSLLGSIRVGDRFMVSYFALESVSYDISVWRHIFKLGYMWSVIQYSRANVVQVLSSDFN